MFHTLDIAVHFISKYDIAWLYHVVRQLFALAFRGNSKKKKHIDKIVALWYHNGGKASKILFGFPYGSLSADVAELADAHGSGPCEREFMGVQVPSSAASIGQAHEFKNVVF